jgi:hypothetical protein
MIRIRRHRLPTRDASGLARPVRKHRVAQRPCCRTLTLRMVAVTGIFALLVLTTQLPAILTKRQDSFHSGSPEHEKRINTHTPTIRAAV